MIKHQTASAFVFHHDATHGWRTGLIQHPIHQCWLMPGGHVEPDENPVEAALREVAEETGLDGVTLLESSAAQPADCDNARYLPPPQWIVEHPVERDNHLAQPHIHVDYKYVMLAPDAEPTTRPDHPFAWFTETELAGISMFDDARDNAIRLFAIVASQNADAMDTATAN